MKNKVYVFLSHDVDWPKQGPGVNHILARKSRFPEDIIQKVLKKGYNPYYNIPEIMSAEEAAGIRSTFFFRPLYDDGTDVHCYKDDIADLIKGGWEVGVHLNSANTAEEIKKQKKMIEKIIGGRAAGCRVHYLRVNEESFENIAKAGFLYDSSLVYSKDRIDPRNMGYTTKNSLIIFPITLMDAYMFTYMKIKEEEVLKVVEDALNKALNENIDIITILWHTGSVQMKGGRAFFKLAEFLASRDYVEVIRGIDAYKLVTERIQNERK